MAVATTEPSQITAGFSSEWDKTLADYPASLYLLSYTLVPISGGAPIRFDASPNGSTHEVRLNTSDTQQYDDGLYQLTGYVSEIGGDFKTEINRSRVEVLPGPSSEADRRSYAERIHEELKSTYEKLASKSLSTANVNGKQYTQRDLADLRAEIAYWKNQIRNEQGGAVKTIAVTFKSVS